MPNPQVPVNSKAINSAVGLNASAQPAALASLTLTVDNYAAAYVAPFPAAGIHGHVIVPKNTAQVGNVTVTVTANATDAAGVVIPPATFAYDIVGAPPPPPAVSVAFGTATVGAFGGVPGDPGSPTVPA